jgi:predicted nucleotidyltransferase component of viral defense system
VIPEASITYWSRLAPWPAQEQVEQDLLLSRLIVEIASHPVLGSELVFRGGTCLHKLHLDSPRRYSQDLDYVRATHGPVGALLDGLREIAVSLGMQARTDVRQFPKVFLQSDYESGRGPLRIKIEINTYETSPARPYIRLPYEVASPWWSGRADVLTFEPAELMATKLRALYQRRKGRDLFDLWLALTELKLSADQILSCFAPYRPAHYTAELAIANLNRHLSDRLFRRDLEELLMDPASYDVDEAAALVTRELLERI